MAEVDPTATAQAGVTTAPAWQIENDPIYQAAIQAGQAKFNYSRNEAKAGLQNATTNAAVDRRNLDTNAKEARRRLAGSYAARGMAGGRAGALALSEAQQIAQQITARTSITDQLAALNRNYLANYGTDTGDWTGTLIGQQYKTDAVQAAINAAKARAGIA